MYEVFPWLLFVLNGLVTRTYRVDCLHLMSREQQNKHHYKYMTIGSIHQIAVTYMYVHFAPLLL